MRSSSLLRCGPGTPVIKSCSRDCDDCSQICLTLGPWETSNYNSKLDFIYKSPLHFHFLLFQVTHSLSVIQVWFWLGLINRVVMILATFPEHLLGSGSGPCVHALPPLILPIIHFVLEATEAQNYGSLKLLVQGNVIGKWWSQHLNPSMFDSRAYTFDNNDTSRLTYEIS